MSHTLPDWANEMRDCFRSAAVSQFIVHGNIFDLVPYQAGGNDSRTSSAASTTGSATGSAGLTHLSLQKFLDDVMFARFDVVLRYDRGHGLRATRGSKIVSEWMKDMGSEYDQLAPALSHVRDPAQAMEIIDRFLLRTINLKTLSGLGVDESGQNWGSGNGGAQKIAVVIDFAEYVIPRGDALQLGSQFAANIIKALSWANDPALLEAQIATVFVTEKIHDLADDVANNPHAAKLEIPLPDEKGLQNYVDSLTQGDNAVLKDLSQYCQVPVNTLGSRLTGLSRVGVKRALALAVNRKEMITHKQLTQIKKDLIEKDCADLLEFYESPWTLDNVAGHDAAKAWLRQDAQLLKNGSHRALPMGYLVAGRIGTGKTFLVQCWAGELGVPCVVLKNFRDRWVGATESNLEKIFNVLRALGQVVVFVDEADQVAGKRAGSDTDGGLSGRVYAMLAKEMSQTSNRGKIIWVFATSRPDLVEVDLKRQGRLDVHIPLFAPQDEATCIELWLAMARKLKVDLKREDLPAMRADLSLGGNEIEGMLVRALREFELARAGVGQVRSLKEILAELMEQMRPSAHQRQMKLMDLLAVRECTDQRFLPEAYASLSPAQVEEGIAELQERL